MSRSFRDLGKETRSFAKELSGLEKVFDRKSSRGIDSLRDGIKAANAESVILGKNLKNAMEAGAAAGSGIKDGIRSAQGEAKVLGDILKANALIKVGEGFGNALTSGARSTMGILGKGMGFVGKQFSSAVKDELEDMQARGSLFGSLKKSGVFKGTTAEEDTRDYRQTKRISRINEEVIGNIVRDSPVNTGTVSTLNRQLTDNLLPQMLKSRGITDLGTQSEAQLEKTFKGTDKEKGVGTELAKLYEQMATLMPSPQYAKMGAMGFTQALTSGTINRQLAIFEGNPVLVEALKTIDGGIAATSDIGKRVQILKKALEVASPTMMLDEMRLSVAGGMQSIGDTLTNPNVGILSFAMEVQGQGKKTLEDFGKVNGKVIKNSAYALKLADFEKKQDEKRATMLKKGNSLQAIQTRQEKEKKDYIEKLDDILKNANSPLERIGVSLSPVLQSIAGMLNAMGSVFMGPVNAAMKTLDIVFAQLTINIDNIASNLRAKKYTGAEGIGRLFAEIVKTIATIFDPAGLGGAAGEGIDKMFADFMKGFNSEGLNGSYFLDLVIKGIQEMIMKLLFTEGDMTKGLTPLGDGLGKIFLLLSAPAFVNALIMGLVPLALQGMGGMLFGTLKGLGPKLATAKAAKDAAKLATAQKAAAAARNARFANMALGAAPVTAAVGGEAVAGGGILAGLSSIPVLGWIAALGTALVILEGPIMAFTKMLQNIGKKMQTSSNWVTSSFGQVVQGIGQLFGGITEFFNGLWEIVSGLVMGEPDRVVAGIKKLFSGVVDTIVGIGRLIGGMGGIVVAAIGNMFKTIANLISRATPKNVTTVKDKKGKNVEIQLNYGPGEAVPGSAVAKGSAHPFMGNLGQAVNYEMANKPSGSNLVVANSSETVIPAAGGLGMSDFMATLTSGFSRVAALVSQTSQQSKERDDKQTSAFNSYKTVTDNRLIAMQQQLAKMGSLGAGGAMFGSGGPNSVISVGKQLLGMGLQVGMNPFFQYGRGFLPGGGGYIGQHSPNSLHYSGRAVDVSGPPAMLDQAYAGLRGTNPTELLWRVPGHFDHLHVAYGMGAGSPAFFNSQSAAQQWESRMAPSDSRIASVTSNSGEFGGGATINAPITINALPGQDENDIANAVLDELERRVSRVRTSSLFFS